MISKDLDRLIKEYLLTVEEDPDFKDVSKSVLESACRRPFEYLKELISSSSLQGLRLTYFGVFKVYKSKVKNYPENLDKALKDGKVDEAYYEEQQVLVNNIKTFIDEDVK